MPKNVRITPQQIALMRRLSAEGMHQHIIASEMGLGQSTISKHLGRKPQANQTRIATTRKARRTLKPRDRSVPIEEQANYLTTALIEFINTWCRTAEEMQSSPEATEEVKRSIRQITAATAEQLWECSTGWLDHVEPASANGEYHAVN
jgi:predicted transcriptional regulator